MSYFAQVYVLITIDHNHLSFSIKFICYNLGQPNLKKFNVEIIVESFSRNRYNIIETIADNGLGLCGVACSKIWGKFGNFICRSTLFSRGFKLADCFKIWVVMLADESRVNIIYFERNQISKLFGLAEVLPI
jgi:hypothetical protein